MSRLIVIISILVVFFVTAPLFLSKGFIGNAGDLHLHYYPMKHYITTRIIQGELPLWNPYTFCGTPVLANPQGGVFYPGSLLFYIFSNDTSFAFKLWTVFHLLFMLLGLWVFIKMFSRGKDIPAFVGALSIVFSSFVIYMIPSGHIIHLAGYSWFGICGILFMSCVDVEYGSSVWEIFRNGKIFIIVLCALAFSFNFLSGHPQGVFAAGVFALSVVVIKIFVSSNHNNDLKEKIHRRGVVLGLWLLLVLLFSFVQYLPSIEFARLAEDVSWRPLARTYSMTVSDFLSILYPSRWGLPPLIGDSVKNPLKISISSFYEKKNLFIGYTALVLTLLGLYMVIRNLFSSVKKKTETPKDDSVLLSDILFFVLFLTGIFLSLGFSLPGYEFIYDNFSFLVGYFRTPSRFYFLAIVASGYFISRAIDYILKNKKVGVGIALIFTMVIFVELFVWNKKFIYTINFDWTRRPDIQVSPGERIFTAPEIPSNISMLNRIPNVNGYDALILKDFFRTFYSFYQPAEYRPSTFLAPSDSKEILMKDFPGWGLRYFVATNNSAPISIDMRGVKIVSRRGAITIYEKNKWTPSLFAPPRIENLTHKGFVSFFPTKINPVTEAVYIRGANNELGYDNGLNLEVKKYSFLHCGEKIVIDAYVSSGGTLVIGDVFYPGWRAWVNGKEVMIERASRAFRALNIDKKGDVKIFLVFMPVSVRVGVVISSVVMVVFVIWFYKQFVDKVCH